MHPTPNNQSTPNIQTSNIPSAINTQPVKLVHSILPDQEFLQYADVQPSISLHQSNPNDYFNRISDRENEIMIKTADMVADQGFI